MQILKGIIFTVAFLLELALLIVVGYWGFVQGRSTFSKFLFCILGVVIVAVLWGLFAAPNSDTRLPFHFRIFFELSMFLLSAFLLFKLGHPSLALFLGILAVITEFIVFFLKL